MKTNDFTTTLVTATESRLGLVLKRQRRLILGNLFVMSTALSTLLFICVCLL
jgi:hypothetical protein